MLARTCDVAVVGAGTAGIAAERSARLSGASTILIDDRFAGTTCASVGCMPSKLLIAASRSAHTIRQAAAFGVGPTTALVEGPAVMRRVRRERDHFVAGVKKSLARLPPGVSIRGRARFVGAATLQLDDGQQIHAKAVVIATGAQSTVPAFLEPMRARVLTNESIFELHDLPRSLAVVGAGPLGLELAQALQRLGVHVEVFDTQPHLSGIQDRDAELACRTILGRELVLRLGVKLAAAPQSDGVKIEWSGPMCGSGVFERVLVAAGRKAQLADLELHAAGIELDAHGTPRYERSTMQCGTSSIFIAGDADAERPVLHEASAEGAIAGRNAAGYPELERVERFTPLSIMFTDPQVAIVGSIPEDGSGGVIRGAAFYEDQGRAKAFDENYGLAHVYAEESQGRLTGATLVTAAAEHNAHLLAWAIQRRWTAHETLQMPFYHPTFEEGLKPALRKICDAVHASLDDSVPAGE